MKLPRIGERVVLTGDHSHTGQRGAVYSHEQYEGAPAFLVDLDTGQRVGVSHRWEWVYDDRLATLAS